MIEKVTAAYKIGSVIRAADVERIEKSRSNSLLNIEPLKISVANKRIAVDDFKEIASAANKLHVEGYSRAHDEITNTAKNLLGLSDISAAQLAGLISNMFTARCCW